MQCLRAPLRPLLGAPIAARPLARLLARPLTRMPCARFTSSSRILPIANRAAAWPVGRLAAVGSLAIGVVCFTSSATLAEPEQTGVRLALCQMMCGSDKSTNIAEARRCVEEAVAGGARLVALPECWNRCAPATLCGTPVVPAPLSSPHASCLTKQCPLPASICSPYDTASFPVYAEVGTLAPRCCAAPAAVHTY